MSCVDLSDGLATDRRGRPVEVDGELHVLEEAFGGDHVELSSLGAGLATVDEEGGGEGGFSVGGVVAEAEHLKGGIGGDGFLDTVEAELSRDSGVEEPVAVDHTEVLELEVIW